MVAEGRVYFSNDAEGRIYCQAPEGDPVPLAPEGDSRYADGVLDRHWKRLISAREDHTGSEGCSLGDL